MIVQGVKKRLSIVEALLEKHGPLLSEELGIPIERNTPAPLFRWWCATLLLSARIKSSIAMRAAAAISARGWTTAHKLGASRWQDRVYCLNRAGYARYDERTATMLGDGADQMLDLYQGDLRNLREQALRQPRQERRLLKEFNGIGDVGADIFFRDVQIVWEEVYPFADARALEMAQSLDLAADLEQLTSLVDRGTFPRLVSALVRESMDKRNSQAHQSTLVSRK